MNAMRTIEGVIERRLLVNYRVAPDVAARLVPQPFRPQLVGGWAVAGICLIRLGQLRPRGVPRAFGLRAENAAHRIAVEWNTSSTPSGTARGVWIPRRDTGSLVSVALGGRLFPGEHHRARFDVEESADRLRVALRSADGTTAVDVSAETAAELTGSRLFGDLLEASRFFEDGSTGYSATHGHNRHDGLELSTSAWRVTALRVTEAGSSFFDDAERFPVGSVTLDCGLLMRQVPVTWHALSPLAGVSPPAPSPCSELLLNAVALGRLRASGQGRGGSWLRGA